MISIKHISIIINSKISIARSSEINDILTILKVNTRKTSYVINSKFDFKDDKLYLTITYKGYKIITRKNFKSLDIVVSDVLIFRSSNYFLL